MRRVLLVAALLVPSNVWAHAELTYPPPRTTAQKTKHCGDGSTTRGANVTTLVPGSTLMVTWNETVDHPGHYRISFDDDGQDFIQPATATENTEGQLNVVKDLIPDRQGGGVYMFEITLPDIECNNCTLQLIQMMTDKPPYATTGPDDNDIYYQCADITLSRGAPDAGTGGGGGGGGGDAGTGNGGGGGNNNGGDIGGGCSTSGGAAALPIALGLLGLVVRRRRQR